MNIIVSKIKNTDLKSKKCYLVLAAAAIVILLVCLVSCFCGSPDPVWIDSSWENQLAFHDSLNEDQRREFYLTQLFSIDNKMGVTDIKTVPRNGKKYSRILKEWRDKFGKENCKKLDEFLKTCPETEFQDFMKGWLGRLEHYVWVIGEGKKILNENFAPRYECVKISVGGWNAVEKTVWLDCEATLRNKSTGEEHIEKYEIRSVLDRTENLIFKPRR